MDERRFAEAFFAAVLMFGMGFLPPKAWGQVRVSIAQAQDLLTIAPGYIARAKQCK